jgi:ABC-type transporter Mla subunit MlaD
MSEVTDRLSEGLTRDRLRLEVRRARRPFLVWLALLLAGAAALTLLLGKLHLPWPWQSRYTVSVLVDDAKGVVPGSDEVRISGVTVGKIIDVGLRNGQPVLRISIDSKYGPLYRDARLRLRPGTPLQDMYLDVVKRGEQASGKLPEGGTLLADRTETPVDIGRVIDVFNADVRPRVKASIDALGHGLGDHGDDFRRALVELAPFLGATRRVANENATRERQTRRLVHNFALMNEELARRDSQVTRLVGAGSAALGELASVERPLGQFIEELPPMLRQLPRSFSTLRSVSDELDPAFSAMLPAARALPAALDALQRFGPEAQTGLSALDRPLPRLNALVQTARPVATNLSASFAALRPQAPRLNRITAAVVPCELAVGKFFQWTLSVLKFADIHGVFPRGQDVGGVHTTGEAGDLGLTAGKSCAGGGPRK